MKLLLRFPSHLHERPYTAEIILETGAKINIDKARVDATHAEVVIDVPDDKARRVVELFKERGVEVRILKKLIVWDEMRCVHCGACMSVCPRGAFKFGPDWRVSLDEKKCVGCGVCVNACPLRVLSVVEGAGT
ncbi:4Fe-4S binding protein [Candidatus Alkanophaga liquidiphilum]|nr:Formate hydrogenlyase subunit 6/NADH:ubiquinone oxidoreductase 23 kD subunit [Candidatus Alkanophaga liquidiphilum]